MTTKDMIRALGNVIEEYKNKPVFTGQTDIPMMCRDVINKLKELSNPWHTGTPAEEGAYLIKLESQDKEVSYTIMPMEAVICGNKLYVKNDELSIVAWQKIEEGEEVNG